MLWIRISDIVEEQRKKKFGQVPDASSHGHGPSEGWVTADSVQPRAGGGPYAPGQVLAPMELTTLPLVSMSPTDRQTVLKPGSPSSLPGLFT